MPTELKTERRAARRYPLVADVEYRITDGWGQVKTGRGTTIDISRFCVFFSPENPVPAGINIELSIPWPAWLNGTVALSLLVIGKTVHVRGECVAVRIGRYHFRTRSSRPNARTQPAAEKIGEPDGSSAGVRLQKARSLHEPSFELGNAR